jgi:DNA-binding response OmpR family regulator
LATGRILLVHESAGTRAMLSDLLAREGLVVDAVDSTYACMDRFVDEPADVVVVGLADVDEEELDLIPALKHEERAPRVLVTFPGPRREMAVRALGKGADGYVLEPFYRDEVLGLVRGQLVARESGPYYALSHLAREVAHAVNNPLQVVALLLAKEKVTRQELLKGIPEQTSRIEAVIRHLREFGAIPPARPETVDARQLAEAAGIGLEPGEAATARVDAANFSAALAALREALAARTKGGVRGRLATERDALALRCAVPAAALEGEDVTALLDSVFVVAPTREVLPGLARARALLEGQQGSLSVEKEADRLLFVVRVPRA